MIQIEFVDFSDNCISFYMPIVLCDEPFFLENLSNFITDQDLLPIFSVYWVQIPVHSISKSDYMAACF